MTLSRGAVRNYGVGKKNHNILPHYTLLFLDGLH
jgi:hypothetical protein